MNPIKDVCYLYEIIYHQHPECRYDKGTPRFLPTSIAKSRFIMMEEELYEYADAVKKQDLEAALDALIDLMVFVCGTVYLHGFTSIFSVAWKRVMQANSQKRPGPKNRGTNCDMQKPKNWSAPTFKDLLL